MITKEIHIKNISELYPNKKILHTYKNGNHWTTICSDGTRVRETEYENDTKFKFDFAENADVMITKFCDAGCQYCHEGATVNGKHADLRSMTNLWDSWVPGTEIAIGGGNALAHPDIEWFTEYLSSRGVVCNITVNQKHIWDEKLEKMIKAEHVKGIGISLTNSASDADMNRIRYLEAISHRNVVVHTIAGILSEKDMNVLKGKKILILGYKDNVGRGVNYKKEFADQIDKNIKWLANDLKKISKWVNVMSFDNLALKQLDAKKALEISDKEWKLRFQGKDYGDPNGEDAPSTFYLDAVNKMIGRSSTQPYNERIKYINQTFEEAFKASLSNYKINEREYGELNYKD